MPGILEEPVVIVVDVDHADRRQDILPRGRIDLELAGAVLPDERDALGRIGVLDERERRARAPDAELRHNRLDAARQVDEDEILASDPSSTYSLKNTRS